MNNNYIAHFGKEAVGMEYYGNNDYRDYLAHYGRKGMRKGKHLPGVITDEKKNGNARVAENYHQGAMIRRKMARMESLAAARSTGKEKLKHEKAARNLNIGVRNTTHWSKKYRNRAEQAKKRKANAGFTNWVKRMTGNKISHVTRALPKRHKVV